MGYSKCPTTLYPEIAHKRRINSNFSVFLISNDVNPLCPGYLAEKHSNLLIIICISADTIFMYI